MSHLIGYCFDDGGRQEAGYKGKTGDCVPRAIAIVTGLPYKQVYKAMADAMKEYGYAASGNAYQQRGKKVKGQRNAKDIQVDVIQKLGLKKVKFEKGVRPTYSEAYAKYGNCLVFTTKHAVALVDGKLRDTWDNRTYDMLVPYCRDCKPNRPGDGSGGGHKCTVCGRVSDGQTLYEERRERKAMSIFVPGTAVVKTVSAPKVVAVKSKPVAKSKVAATSRRYYAGKGRSKCGHKHLTRKAAVACAEKLSKVKGGEFKVKVV